MSQQPSILVVDDEMGILDVLRILLKGEGFDVTTAQGGKAGLEALKGNPPDIVLTDIKMPGVSGTEILAAVREQDPETPVILMTAQASLQSALPESLLESELFGHVKGSFTGAVRDKQGLFAAARGGTFFLDEIGEMSPATQVKLLRVLQEREAIPVGGTEAIPVDVRVVAATNRDLEDDIKRGRFRSDLYYRLNVIAIELPPLRERREDIPIFVKAFLERIAQEHGLEPKQLSPQAQEVIMAYDWPGNVRELENALERAAVLTKGDTIELATLPEKLAERRAEPLVAERPHANPTLDVIERAYITWVLQSEGGNKTRAAEVLGIDPSTLYRKLSRYEGDVPPG